MLQAMVLLHRTYAIFYALWRRSIVQNIALLQSSHLRPHSLIDKCWPFCDSECRVDTTWAEFVSLLEGRSPRIAATKSRPRHDRSSRAASLFSKVKVLPCGLRDVWFPRWVPSGVLCRFCCTLILLLSLQAHRWWLLNFFAGSTARRRWCQDCGNICGLEGDKWHAHVQSRPSH